MHDQRTDRLLEMWERLLMQLENGVPPEKENLGELRALIQELRRSATVAANTP